jgi:raffinose/stachyose/melibiose transport system permease protein
MTKGGPANASQVLTTYLYQEGFWFQRFGSASAAGLVLLVICMVFSYVYIRQGRIGQSEFEY